MTITTEPIEVFENIVVTADLLNNIWRRHADGKLVSIPDMPDEYLQSTIAMIKRGYDSHGRAVSRDRDNYLPALEREAIKRGLLPAEDGWDA